MPVPASPWKPFEADNPSEHAFGATWMYADDDNWANNDALVAARHSILSEPITPPHPARNQKRTAHVVDLQDFLDNMPTPPPTMDLPTVPKPSKQAISRAADGRPPVAPSATYKNKKPEGLCVTTMPVTPSRDPRKRLHKASKDSLRVASASSAGGSSRLMSALRIGDRSFSLGKGKGLRSKVDDGEPRSVFEDW
ncbi:hypothetical protein NLU13_9947 [Sarocladium strictum]|uniref:Uncharacterized protein n=1 Tax=Sarocladium strictum TaxID=5046 RepID=A0AA39G8U9_SARSR|nr:hypothetical protein NLU13_9947 [Sarocladium strictum]